MTVITMLGDVVHLVVAAGDGVGTASAGRPFTPPHPRLHFGVRCDHPDTNKGTIFAVCVLTLIAVIIILVVLRGYGLT